MFTYKIYSKKMIFVASVSAGILVSLFGMKSVGLCDRDAVSSCESLFRKVIIATVGHSER